MAGPDDHGSAWGSGAPGDRQRVHWFEAIADHLGAAYLRYSFTMGTEQEVDFLVGALGLRPGMRVLDVGCGPGRHAVALGRRGIGCVGLDISTRFLEVAAEVADREGLSGLVSFERADARALVGDPRFDGAGFDAAISLCQGAFGLGGPPDVGDPQNLQADSAVLAGIRGALRAGGRCAVSAFSAYFQVRWLEETDSFDAAGGLNHELAEIRDGEGTRSLADLWTTCYTPRELRLIAERVGLSVDHVWSVTPGGYAMATPTLDSHEFLLVAHRPH